MSAQKISEEQIAPQQWLMGKGRYILLQSLALTTMTELPFARLQQQAGAAQGATKYLQ